MAYIKVEDASYPYSEQDIKNLFPNVSFAIPFNPSSFGFEVVFPSKQPESVGIVTGKQ